MTASISTMSTSMLQSTQGYYLRQGDFMPDWKAWTVAEAAEITGYNAEYIRRLCRRDEIEHTKIGRVLLIKADSLQAYIDKVSSMDDGRYGPKEK